MFKPNDDGEPTNGYDEPLRDATPAEQPVCRLGPGPGYLNDMHAEDLLPDDPDDTTPTPGVAPRRPSEKYFGSPAWFVVVATCATILAACLFLPFIILGCVVGALGVVVSYSAGSGFLWVLDRTWRRIKAVS